MKRNIEQELNDAKEAHKCASCVRLCHCYDSKTHAPVMPSEVRSQCDMYVPCVYFTSLTSLALSVGMSGGGLTRYIGIYGTVVGFLKIKECLRKRGYGAIISYCTIKGKRKKYDYDICLFKKGEYIIKKEGV